METPPNVLGILDDHWFRWVGDYGNAGPDKGQGGKFLILPPGYTGEVPKGYFVMRPTTYGVDQAWRVGEVELVNERPSVQSCWQRILVSLRRTCHPLANAHQQEPNASNFIEGH